MNGQLTGFMLFVHLHPIPPKAPIELKLPDTPQNMLDFRRNLIQNRPARSYALRP